MRVFVDVKQLLIANFISLKSLNIDIFRESTVYTLSMYNDIIRFIDSLFQSVFDLRIRLLDLLYLSYLSINFFMLFTLDFSTFYNASLMIRFNDLV